MEKDTILIVDDEPVNRLVLERMLRNLGYDSRVAKSGHEALSALDETIDLVLLDVNMPGLNGFEVAQQIRAAKFCNEVPIIMVTALNTLHDRLVALEAGANDFICKPVDLTELRIRVGSQLNLKHSQDELKKSKQELERNVQLRTAELLEANERLASLATTDSLTGLANHRRLVTLLEEEIDRCVEQRSYCSVLFIDIDHFKALNDSLGHAVGDSVLKRFGEFLQTNIGSGGTAGRWGGEEFLCILPEVLGPVAVERAEEIRQSLVQNSLCEAGSITCSIGVASFPRDGRDRSTLAEAADKAMYVAKSLGRNQVQAAEDVVSGYEALRSKATSREQQALEGLVDALATLVSIRDACTGFHADDVGDLSKRVASAMNLSPEQVQLVGLVGKLHDVGKVAIPDSVLQKPGPLSDEERLSMKLHPAIGAEVISRVPSLRAVAPAIRAHHERWDGTGYPDGLAGEAIPIAARIVAVTDAYCAMTTDRPYRKAGSAAGALAELRLHSGSQFCPTVVTCIEKLLSEERTAAA